METSGVYFGSLQVFIRSVKLENIRIGTSLNIPDEGKSLKFLIIVFRDIT